MIFMLLLNKPAYLAEFTGHPPLLRMYHTVKDCVS